MIYFIMSNNRKVIASRNVSALDPLDYDVNETNVRLKDLDNTIKGRIDNLQKYHKWEKTQTPEMCKGDLISQLAL